MRRKPKIGIFAIALVVLPAVSQSQDAAEKAFMDAKMKMHESMPVEYAGNPDVEFVKSMIPHHQGAIDMAEIELKYGKDAQARAFAEKIIKAQEAEIEELNEWLAHHGK